MNVLCVGLSRDNVKLVEIVLTAEGHNVVSVGGVDEALKLINVYKSIVVMSARLVGGEKILDFSQRDDEGRVALVKILVFTGDADRGKELVGDRGRAIVLGQPASSAALIEAVEKLDQM